MEGRAQPPLEQQRKALRQKAERLETEAAEARRMLEHPLVGGAIDHYIQRVRTAWEDSKPGELEKREVAWQQLQAAKAIRAYLTETISRGKLATVTAAAVLDGSSGHGEERQPSD